MASRRPPKSHRERRDGLTESPPALLVDTKSGPPCSPTIGTRPRKVVKGAVTRLDP